MAIKKDQLRERIWRTVESNIEGYVGLIEILMNDMSEDQLKEVLKAMGVKPDCNHCGETLTADGCCMTGTCPVSDTHEDDEPECVRCSSALNTKGCCTDETCPFSETDQDDERGWIGHPEHPDIEER